MILNNTAERRTKATQKLTNRACVSFRKLINLTIRFKQNAVSPPMLNGIVDRSNTTAPLAALTSTAAGQGGAPGLVGSVAAVPAAGPAPTPGLVPPISVVNRTPTENTPGEVYM